MNHRPPQSFPADGTWILTKHLLLSSHQHALCCSPSPADATWLAPRPAHIRAGTFMRCSSREMFQTVGASPAPFDGDQAGHSFIFTSSSPFAAVRLLRVSDNTTGQRAKVVAVVLEEETADPGEAAAAPAAAAATEREGTGERLTPAQQLASRMPTEKACTHMEEQTQECACTETCTLTHADADSCAHAHMHVRAAKS
ncbi:unnamed protein product [Gadus morhua 'NCC']